MCRDLICAGLLSAGSRAYSTSGQDGFEEDPIAIHGSNITLSGTVGDWAKRETAVNSAWATPDVSNVVDMMTLAH